MPGLQLFRASTLAPEVIGDDYHNYPTSRVMVGSFSEGDLLMLRCRYAECFMNATTVPPWLAWEGPFLRIMPHTAPGSVWDANTVYAKAQMWGENERTGTSPAYTAQGYGQFYFDIDAMCGSPIVLPFSCDVILWTGLSGIWLFDSYMTKQARLPNAPAAARTYPHTRRMGRTGITVRRFFVPPGAVSAYSGGVPITGAGPFSIVEDTGKLAGGGTSYLRTYYPGGSVYQGGAVPIGGARTWELRSDGLGSVEEGVFTQFNIQFG